MLPEYTSESSPSSGAGTRGIILVAFGTRQKSALAVYRALETDFRSAFPEHAIVWAYTSAFIRKKLALSKNPVMSVSEALAWMAANSVRDVVLQSLHILAGEEFTSMERSAHAALSRHQAHFDSVRIARPLLESLPDCREAVNAVLASLPPEREPGDAVLFMAHGHGQGRGDLVLTALGHTFRERDPLIFTATVEGSPALADIMRELAQRGVKRVWLAPFMLVAGEHAKHDMMGEHPQSWASRLTAGGFMVEGRLIGLGEIEGIRKIFIRHAAETRDDLLLSKDTRHP